MSNRFHNKFHRHNHHTRPTDREGLFPDSAYDPIASAESPFQGEFVLDGNLTSLSSISAAYGVSGQDGLFHGNMTIEGNLYVLGDTTMLDTMVYASSAIRIDGNISQNPLIVNQSSDNDLSQFTGRYGDYILFDTFARVGIGKRAEQKLDVDGTVQSKGLYVKNGQRNCLIVNENTGQIGIGASLAQMGASLAFVTLSSDALNEFPWLIKAYSTDPTGGFIRIENNSGNMLANMILRMGPNAFDLGEFGIGTETNNPITLKVQNSERIKIYYTSTTLRKQVEIKDNGAALNIWNNSSTNYYRLVNIGSTNQSNAALSFVHSTVGDVLHLNELGYLGVGTVFPSSVLYIARPPGETGQSTAITLDNGTTHQWMLRTGNQSQFKINSTDGNFLFTNATKDIFRIDSTGHVGIGANVSTGNIVSPPYYLTINSNKGTDNPSTPVVALLENGSLTTTISHSSTSATPNTIIGTVGNLIISSGFSEKARFTTDGRLLIGTDQSNFSKLNIYSNFSQTSGIRFEDINVTYPKIWTIGPRNGSFVLTDNNTPRVVVNTTGKVGINTNNPQDLLHIEGVVSVRGPDAKMLYYGTGGENYYQIQNTGLGPGNAVLIFTESDGGGERMRLNNNGQLGLGTTAPNKLLTVGGEISSTSVIWDLAGSSNNWNSVYSSTARASASWDSVYSSTARASASWDNVYSSIARVSASWDNVYSSTARASASWDSVYSYVNRISADDFNSISLMESLTSRWEGVYAFINSVSSNDLNSLTVLESTSANWNSVYTSVNNTSGFWDKTYANVSTLSSNWQAAYASGANATSVYSTVNSNSGTWISLGAASTVTQNNSAVWTSTYGTVNGLSGSWGAPFNVPNAVNASFTTGTLNLPTGGGAGVDHTITGTAATNTIAITAVTGGINTITYVLTNKTDKPIQFFFGPKIFFRRGNGWKSNTANMSGAYLTLPLSASCNMRATDAGSDQFVSIW